MKGRRFDRPPFLDRDRALDEEIEHHIRERTERLVAEGMDPEEARRQAEARFGDPDRVRWELTRVGATDPGDATRATGFEVLRRDVTFAVRQLRRNPAFSAVAIFTLALGIGAATAIFGVVKAVVLDPLPWPEPDRLVELSERAPRGVDFSVSIPNFVDFRERLGPDVLLAASNRADFAVTTDGEPLNVVANQVTPEFFTVFGGEAHLGRTLTPDETGPEPPAVAVLSHALWSNLFAGDPDALGRTLDLDGTPHMVVGVMPAGWEPLMDTDVWVPLTVMPEHQDRGDHWLMVPGRLAPGATVDEVRAEAGRVADALAVEHPVTNGGWSADVRPLKEVVVGPERIQAGWMLLGAVGLLLLMACASVSTLLLARAATRGREMGLRTALGAGRSRIVRQLLTESLVTSGTAAVLGLALAHLGIPLLQAVSPADTPRIGEASVDLQVVLFAAAVAALTGVLFGLAPVLHLLRGDPRVVLGSGTRSTASGGATLRNALVAGQVAVSVTLLVGTVLLAASFLRMLDRDVGLELETTVAIPLMMSGDRFTVPERWGAIRRITTALEALPGVEAAGAINILPFSGMSTVNDINVQGRAITAETAPYSRWRSVSWGYFDAAGLEPLAGRVFDDRDLLQEAEPVAVVTETLARRVFGEPEAAVGERIAQGWEGSNWRRVVGVVPDMEDQAVREEAEPVFFMPELGGWPWVVFLVRRVPGSPATPAAALRGAVWEVEPEMSVPTIQPLDEAFRATVAAPRFNALLLAVFAVVALVLATLGVYGVMLFQVSRRTREMGVRIALGAEPARLVRSVVASGLRVTGVGIAGGLLLAFLLSRYLETLLYRTPPRDPAVLIAATLVVALTAALAAWLPARRAARVDPRVALSSE